MISLGSRPHIYARRDVTERLIWCLSTVRMPSSLEDNMRLKQSARIIVVLFLAGTTFKAVEPGRPSKTAVYVTAARAVGAKDPDPQLRNPDYLAITFLGPRERAVLPD